MLAILFDQKQKLESDLKFNSDDKKGFVPCI